MKKILITLITGLFVLTIVAQESQKSFTLDNTVKKNDFRARGVYGLKSMSDGKHYSSIKQGNILVYSYKTGSLTDTLVKGNQLIPEGEEKSISIRRYEFSQDEKKILIPTETEQIYRWSSKSNYYIWDIDSKKLTLLSANGKQRLADFSPDGTKVAFVRGNNLFIKDIQSDHELQLTYDGEDRHIINGMYWSVSSPMLAVILSPLTRS